MWAAGGNPENGYIREAEHFRILSWEPVSHPCQRMRAVATTLRSNEHSARLGQHEMM